MESVCRERKKGNDVLKEDLKCAERNAIQNYLESLEREGRI